jgi:hypothetical protein
MTGTRRTRRARSTSFSCRSRGSAHPEICVRTRWLCHIALAMRQSQRPLGSFAMSDGREALLGSALEVRPKTFMDKARPARIASLLAGGLSAMASPEWLPSTGFGKRARWPDDVEQ